MYRKLIEAGWTLESIEEADYEALVNIVFAQKGPEKTKEVSLKDFIKSI